MKRFLRLILTVFLVAGIGYTVLCLTMKDNSSELGQAINMYNVFAKEEPKYVKIDNAKGRDEAGYGNYEYKLTSYDAQGNPHPIQFTGMGKLKQGHYLKLTTKGTYVSTYEEAFQKDIPHVVYDKLSLE